MAVRLQVHGLTRLCTSSCRGVNAAGTDPRYGLQVAAVVVTTGLHLPPPLYSGAPAAGQTGGLDLAVGYKQVNTAALVSVRQPTQSAGGPTFGVAIDIRSQPVAKL